MITNFRRKSEMQGVFVVKSVKSIFESIWQPNQGLDSPSLRSKIWDCNISWFRKRKYIYLLLRFSSFSSSSNDNSSMAGAFDSDSSDAELCASVLLDTGNATDTESTVDVACWVCVFLATRLMDSNRSDSAAKSTDGSSFSGVAAKLVA